MRRFEDVFILCANCGDPKYRFIKTPAFGNIAGKGKKIKANSKLVSYMGTKIQDRQIKHLDYSKLKHDEGMGCRTCDPHIPFNVLEFYPYRNCLLGGIDKGQILQFSVKFDLKKDDKKDDKKQEK